MSFDIGFVLEIEAARVGVGLALFSAPRIAFTGWVVTIEVRFGDGLRVGRSSSGDTECNGIFL